MIDHCVSTFFHKQEEKAFRIYVSDALQAITQNTTHFLTNKGIQDYGSSLGKRWIDIVTPPEKPKEKTLKEMEEELKPCEEIAADIWKRIRGKK